MADRQLTFRADNKIPRPTEDETNRAVWWRMSGCVMQKKEDARRKCGG